MSDLFNPARTFAAVKFKWQKDDKTYDYVVPNGLEVEPGDKVIVETVRGETEVEVIELKDRSPLAAKPILRKAEPVAAPVQTETKPAEDWNF